MEAVERIQQAASGLVERIAEIESNEQQLIDLERELAHRAAQLMAIRAPGEIAQDTHSSSVSRA